MRDIPIEKISLDTPVSQDETVPTVHPTLRHARLSDLPKLLEFARGLVSGSPIEKFNIDEDRARMHIEKAIISNQNEWLALVSHDNDKPVGVLIAYVIEPLFSSDKFAVECFWYLDPAHRRGRRGIEMMQAYEYWAKLVGCSMVQYGWLTSSPENMKKLYEHTGAELSELIYYKEL